MAASKPVIYRSAMDFTATAFRFWLDGGIAGDLGVVAYPTEGGAGVTGGLGFGFGEDLSKGVGLELQVRELLQPSDDRHVSSIGVIVRFPADDGPWIGLGGTHHHELPWSLYKEDPVDAALATHVDITHRTGFEVAAGWDFAPTAPNSPVASRFRPALQASVAFLPGTDGPLIYGILRATMRLGIK